MDGKKALEGQAIGDSNRQAVTFGAGSTGGAVERYWDYVVYTMAGAFSPNELPDYFSTTQAVDASDKLAATWGEVKAGIVEF